MATLSGFADQLRNQLDIVEVIGSYLPLKKRGREHEAVCPFHQEKTPSFKVSPTKQIFHCFGCGKGGDVIKFIMEIEHLGFREAIKTLADRNGIAMPQMSDQAYSSDEEKRRKALYDVHQLAAEFFAAQLARSRPAKDYVEKRGVSADLAEALNLGFAPDQNEALLTHARQRGFSEGLLREAGLIKESSRGHGHYDSFRGRIIFPICDPVGRVVAFGGRVLDGKAQPKYLNTSETPIYQKGRYLYAYHLAKNKAKELGYAIITEGYMDAIACHQFGFTNAVASLGTAFTDHMAHLLKRVCSRVVFLYDGDEAGQKAMYAGTKVLLAHGFQVNIVALPADDDPDTLLRREGAGSLSERIDHAPDHLDYFVETAVRRHDRHKLEGRVAIVEYLGELIEGTRHPMARQDYVRRLAEFLAVPEGTIARTLFGRKQRTRDAVAEAVASPVAAGQADRHETGLLRLVLEHEEARHAAREMISPHWLLHPQVRAWYERVLDVDERQLSMPAVLELAENENDAAFLRHVFLLESERLDDCPTVYPELVTYLASRYYQKLNSDLNRQIHEAEERGNTALLRELGDKKKEATRVKVQIGKASFHKAWQAFQMPESAKSVESFHRLPVGETATGDSLT